MSKNTFAQDNRGAAILVNMHYGVGFPSQDLAKRFGNHNFTGLGLDFMTSKSHWIIGGDFSYFFSKKVKENVISSLYNVDNTYIYGINRELGIIFLRERGFVGQGYIGKLIKIHPTKARAGLRVTAGAGYMQHKIRIQDDGRSIAQVNGDYAKGYDRLTGGLCTTQSIGYQYLSQNNRINFIISFDAVQGWTKSLRDWDFDTKMKDESKRKDWSYGLRATWILPFFINDSAEKDEY